MRDDTICAICTPLGEGAIGIVRLSGKDAIKIADRIFKGKVRAKDASSHSIHYGKIIEPETRKILDEVLLTVMHAPSTYTREDVVEINAHGGVVALSSILSLCIKEGARLAEPGEFTKRAFLNGRITLPEAEAVLEVVRAKTERALELAQKNLSGALSKRIKEIEEELLFVLTQVEAQIEFPDEPIQPQPIEESVQKAFGLIKELVESGGYTKKFAEGVIVTIVGRPNVGKSSLFNALLGKERAIVAKLSGTTRDAISEDVSMDGAIIKVVDTAGLRKKAEGLQQVAQQKSAEYIKESALLLHVLDASSPLKEEDLWIAERIKGKKRVIVLNKCDLPLKVREEQVRERFGPHPIVYTSCTEGVGVQTLSTLIKEQLQESWPQEFFLINERQRQLICQMREEMEEGMKYLKEETMELFAFHIKEVLSKISQFLGTDVVEGVLERIFLQFCIGK